VVSVFKLDGMAAASGAGGNAGRAATTPNPAAAIPKTAQVGRKNPARLRSTV
jgi:hypothetical protein